MDRTYTMLPNTRKELSNACDSGDHVLVKKYLKGVKIVHMDLRLRL